jgi:hypothetical protein
VSGKDRTSLCREHDHMPAGRRLPMGFGLPEPSIARAGSRGQREGEASVRLGGQAGLDYTSVDMCSELLTRTRSCSAICDLTGRGTPENATADYSASSNAACSNLSLAGRGHGRSGQATSRRVLRHNRFCRQTEQRHIQRLPTCLIYTIGLQPLNSNYGRARCFHAA